MRCPSRYVCSPATDCSCAANLLACAQAVYWLARLLCFGTPAERASFLMHFGESPAAAAAWIDCFAAAVAAKVLSSSASSALPTSGLASAVFHEDADNDHARVLAGSGLFNDLCACLPAVFFGLPAPVLLVPRPLPPATDTLKSHLMPTTAWFAINSALPERVRGAWALAYSSAQHGASFAQFSHRLSAAQRPCVVLVRDKGGAVFGGFVAEPASFRPTFFGSEQCFVFSVLPKTALYFPTGYNTNYAYFNFGMQTLPNGLVRAMRGDNKVRILCGTRRSRTATATDSDDSTLNNDERESVMARRQ
jgi:hypothetical protein